MSHEIENLNGKDCIAYAGEKPWHGLGVEVADDLAPAEILAAAGLDWKVKAEPLFYTHQGKKIETGHKALVRDVDGKALTVVPKDWKHVQNEEAFAFFDDLVKLGHMKMHTAGSLLGGKRVWALAKIEDEFDLRVNGKVTRDKVEGFLLLTNPHEYGRSLDARFTAIRVVCNNTHTLAMRSGTTGVEAVKLNHRKQFDAERVKALLGISHLTMDVYKEQAEFLASRKIDAHQMQEFLAKVFPHCNKTEAAAGTLSSNAKQALELVELQPGAEFAPGTFWNAYNATTFMMDHVIGKGADSRLASSWYGHGRTRKDTALKVALDMAKAA